MQPIIIDATTEDIGLFDAPTDGQHVFTIGPADALIAVILIDTHQLAALANAYHGVLLDRHGPTTPNRG